MQSLNPRKPALGSPVSTPAVQPIGYEPKLQSRMSTNASDQVLFDRIVATPRRETGGSVAANRTDYQQSWAFCLLLTLHEQGEDYTVLLDFHDDVVVLDSAVDPKEMEFYQVKSKSSGNWTITQLLACPKGEEKAGNSICGKMYANKVAFPQVTKSVNFVTNAPFKVRLKDAAKDAEVDQFELKQLAKEISDRYADALMQEHKLSGPPDEVTTNFRREALPHQGHQDQAQGRLATFLEKQKPNGRFAVSAAFRAIASVIAKKTGDERKPANRDDLLLFKAITRANFAAMLGDIMKDDDADRWQDVSAALLVENYPYGAVQRIRGAWNMYEVQKMDASNTPVQRVKEFAVRVAAEFAARKPEFTIRQLIDEGAPRVRQLLGTATPFDDHYLTAALLYHCHEDKPLPPASA